MALGEHLYCISWWKSCLSVSRYSALVGRVSKNTNFDVSTASSIRVCVASSIRQFVARVEIVMEKAGNNT